MYRMIWPSYNFIQLGFNSSSKSEPRIADLVSGSWAQRSDVLCTGDVIVSVNGIDASALTQSGLVQTLDESDRSGINPIKKLL